MKKHKLRQGRGVPPMIRAVLTGLAAGIAAGLLLTAVFAGLLNKGKLPMESMRVLAVCIQASTLLAGCYAAVLGSKGSPLPGAACTGVCLMLLTLLTGRLLGGGPIRGLPLLLGITAAAVLLSCLLRPKGKRSTRFL